MIQMPQTVALLNGFGGGASALVAVSAVSLYRGDLPVFWFTAALALGVGVLTFSGSLVAALKLQGLVSQRPLVVKNHAGLLRIFLGAGALLVALSLFWQEPSLLFPLITVTFTVYGLLMALRIGGADMPVIISFLNSLSGVAASISGLAVENPLLVGVGALVGVAGLILTQIMCRAMNRNLSSVLSGFQKAHKTEAGRAGSGCRGEGSPGRLSRGDPGVGFGQAQKIILIPGYGMALAQAQQAVKDFIDAAQAAGKEIRVGIHPVAGRMPGHMHVLLAEVGIDYEMLHDMEDINPEFPGTDLVVVVGACDVINPAANTAEGTPIYGMPVLNAVEAGHVIVCNLDEKPGYSGVDNTLYDEATSSSSGGTRRRPCLPFPP
jgi:H+-translocating NAD(P) transhydrogenase subunit beta